MGITRETPNPEHGKIDRDAGGDPTGIVREKVKDDILARLPKPTLAQRRRGIELALAEAARWGVTSVQDSISVEDDPAEWNNFLVYEDIEREGKLTARISVVAAFHGAAERSRSASCTSRAERFSAPHRFAESVPRRRARFAHGGPAPAIRR